MLKAPTSVSVWGYQPRWTSSVFSRSENSRRGTFSPDSQSLDACNVIVITGMGPAGGPGTQAPTDASLGLTKAHTQNLRPTAPQAAGPQPGTQLAWADPPGAPAGL